MRVGKEVESDRFGVKECAAHQTRQSGREHLHAAGDAGHSTSLRADCDSHINAGNEVLVCDLIQERATAVAVRATEQEVASQCDLGCGGLKDIRLHALHACIWPYRANHFRGDVDLRPTDRFGRRADDPVRVGCLYLIWIDEDKFAGAEERQLLCEKRACPAEANDAYAELTDVKLASFTERT